MESDSDGEGDLEVVYSSMEQPPLIKQLRGILSEYPDNGQIIKELIQNAEDAGASEVKIIYDERVIRSEEDKKNKFKEFFKAPALCVTNNSLFKKKDWKGIKMIASSVKEDDKLKVGRFGLGFKSVFHMTDYPCILSGDTVLLIDPTKPSDQVNAEFKLKNLNKYKGLDTFLAAFESKGIDRKVIEDGNYPGTIFWFPLRDSPSKISSTLYDKQKVTDLLTSFEKDSSETLVFLCHLANISLYIESETGQLSKVAGTEISNKGDSAVHQRLSFKEAVKEAPYPENEPIICSYFLSLRTYNRYSEPEDTKWIVVQYCMGNNSSENLKQLAQDSDLCYTPLAGVATPVESSTSIALEGHVFCFLPLPREGSVLTGLPVHVNGFFALSQNRHHLKWSTSDQKGQNITDKSILWNQMMIEECIPAAYEALINHLIRESHHVENPQVYIDTILRAIPSYKSTLDKWAQIPHQLAAYFNEAAFLYCTTKCQYVTIHEAKFATFTDIPSTKSHIKQDIVKVIARTNLSYVELKAETCKKLECYASRKLDDFQPSKFANILRHNRHIFQHLTNPERYSVLSYLLSDGDYNCIDNLPVLPVSSGDWETCNIDCPLFLCDTHMHGAEVDLFPSFRNRLVVQTSEMEQFVWSNLQKIATDGHYLQKMGISAFKSFMMQSLEQEGQSDFIISNQRDLDWLRRIWKYIDKSSFDMEKLQNIPLVPEITVGTWDNVGTVNLHTLSGLLLQKKGISHEISQCFQLLGVTVLPEFPSWLPVDKVSSWLHTCQELSIDRLLSQLWDTPESGELVKRFNTTASDNNRDSFVEYMSQFANLDNSSQNFLKCLQIFRKGKMALLNNIFTSVNEHRNFITISDIPVKLPKTCIIASSRNHNLLSKLGAMEIDRNNVINMILRAMQNDGNYTQEECNTFMLYVLEHFYNFEHSDEIINLARQICFLKTDSGEMRPADLFNPDDKMLQDFFQGEKDKLPFINSMNERQKTALKKLGLKDAVGVKDVATSAAWVHAQRNNLSTYEINVSKSQAILEILNKQTGLLNEQFQNTSLKMFLSDLCFISCSHKKPEHFPASLTWYPERFCKPFEARNRNYENECLVGATVPLIDSSFEHLDQKFGWNAYPNEERVIQQLLHIKDCYIMQEKANVLPLVKQIYYFLSKNLSSVQLNQDDKIIWTGEKFECPASVITTCTSSDIQDLSPYFYRIPPEFAEFIPFFEHVGCNPTQTVSVLQQALHKIRDQCKENDSYDEIDRNMDITKKILEKLAERRNECINDDVLLPVQTMNANCLRFHPASKCTADKNAATYQHEEGDNSIVFVDSRIPHELAEALGAKTLNQQILSGTESMGIEGFGQNERLTDRISKLITDSYRDGLSVPKELIQNADDAGATVVKFVYDEREHQDARELLITQDMADCQGPAIVVYNNATFSKADFDNIKKLNGATKASDTNKIGTFGLGFCAVYNLTDLPSIVSRFSVVIFDPQKKYLKNAVEDSSPGIRIDFSKSENKKLLRIHKDQFKPYHDLFGCDMDKLPHMPFDGTLFRLPLRTKEQSQSSEISKIAYNRDEVHDLFTMLIENAGNMLLFTQNVEQLELYHIPKDSQIAGTGILLFSVTKIHQNKSSSVPGTILQKVSTNLSVQKQFTECQHLNIDLQLTEHCVSVFPRFEHYPKTVTAPWLVVWKTGIKEFHDMTNELKQKRAVPLSAVAVLTDASFTSPLAIQESGLSFYSSGYLFCFLPLPIETKLSFHVNGSFDITSDRKGLKSLTDDDKKARSSDWNEYILMDATVNALFAILEHFTSNCESSQYIYYQLWPGDYKKIVKPLYDSFYTRLVSEEKHLFYGQGKWVAFSDVAFLDPSLQSKEIGKHLYEMLFQFGLGKKVLIDIPEQIVKALSKQHDIEQNIIKEVEFLDIFLSSIQDKYWTTRTTVRNKILIFALRLENNKIQEKLKKCRCIPVQGHEIFKKPCELINPIEDVACLFSLKDAVFPSEDLQQQDLLLALSGLGMVGEMLPLELLIDRFSSVRKLAEEGCALCSLTRCCHLLYYINRYCKEELDLSPLAEIHVLPVLSCPDGWKFSWFAETDETLVRIQCFSPCIAHVEFGTHVLALGQPKVLYRQNAQRLGGMVTSIIDEKTLGKTETGLRRYNKKSLYLLRVEEMVPHSLITSQLAKLHTEYKNREYQYQELYEILEKCFAEIQQRIRRYDSAERESLLEEMKRLCDKPIILVEKSLYAPERVVFNLKHNCLPHLVKLPDSERFIRKELYRAMGVREKYTVENIIDVLIEKKTLWEDKVCDEVETIKNILENLESLEEFVPDSCRNYIIAPDAEGYLLPISDLVLTDDSFESSVHMHVVHSSISPILAEKLGAKQKKEKCFEEISIGIRFGQKENLISRLKGLLSAYSCDSDILKELLQNADDANATEIHFIKDYRNHNTDRIFSQSCANLQGPSLCVYNNSYFTEEDLQGIHDLGCGSKANDPAKTGQYGIGFNSVYHITDTPSFMSKGPGKTHEGVLCIFDPLCSHLPGVKHDEPGIQCKVSDLRSNFQDVLLGFLEEFDLFENNTGTLFRLPLRTEESAISYKRLCVEELDKLFHDMTKDLFEALLFVKNIECIRVCNVSNGQMVKEYCLRVEMSDESRRKRQEFFKFMKEMAKKAQNDKSELLQIEARDVSYEATITDSTGRCESYFIVQRLGFHKDTLIPCTVSEAFKENTLGYMPLGGVAYKVLTAADVVTQSLNKDKNTGENSDNTGEQLRIKSRIFCYLPLPGSIPIPVHLNGHFALDHESRRGLWKYGVRQSWNETLIKHVITPAYVEAIDYWKKMFSNYESELKNWAIVKTFSKKYHLIFPLYKEIADDYLRNMTKYLFEAIILEKHAYFPVCQKQFALLNGRAKIFFKCKWIPLALERFGQQELGYFNNLKNHKLKRQDCYALENILKQLDMNIIHSPRAIKQSIEDCGLKDILVTTPEAIVTFLTTYKNGPCHFGDIDSVLSETKIQNTENLRLLLETITNAENFFENIEELPILLTEDSRLHIFKKETKIYTSKFYGMFPASKQLFIHNTLTDFYPIEELKQRGLVCPFTVSVFRELIPYDIRYKLNQKSEVEWNAALKKVVSERWIAAFWQFLCFEYEENKKKNENKTTSFKEFIKDFIDWAVLPSKGMQYNSLLIKVADGFKLLKLMSFEENQTLYIKVRKLWLPSLDHGIFSTDNLTVSDTAITCSTYDAVESLITQYCDPQMFLKCLYAHLKHWQKHFVQDALPRDALVILKYFSRSFEIETLPVNEQAVSMLKALPLYEAHDGSLIKLLSTAYEVPSNIPTQGLSEFAKRSHISLLKNISLLEVLFETLSVQKMTSCEMYAKVILPSICFLPRSCWLKHITHIKDHELHTSFQKQYNKNQQLIIDLLKQVDFIETENGPKTCAFFFNHENVVFTTMCASQQFLPTPFQSEDWVLFIALLGMPMTVTDELLIQFAEAVANSRLDDDIEKKSKVVLNCFLETLHEWDTHTYQRICEISFIVPEDLRDIHRSICQRNSYKRLICMRDSVQAKDIDICWSTMNVLPFDMKERTKEENRKYCELLGIHSVPPLLSVLRHFQNISQGIANNINRGTKIEVDQLMFSMYDFLNQQGRLPESKNMLEQFPIIHLPAENKMMTVNRVVLNLSESQELKPYLYKAPMSYGQFFDLFQQLGTSVNAQFWHYLHVLEQIYAKTYKIALTVQELEIVRCVLEQIQICITLDNVDYKGKKLYLPNEKKFLCLSTELTVWDNEFLKDRMKMETSITYFIGFRNICPSIKDPVGFVKMLPSDIRPKLLSLITDEKLNVDRNSINQHSIVACRLMSFIRSQEFIIGVCRIKKHHSWKFVTEDDVKIIQELLYRIRIIEVSTLETFLEYNGQKVENSSEPCDFFYEEDTIDGEKVINFFFKKISGSVDLGIIDILSSGIAAIILKFVNISTDASLKLLEIMRKIGYPGSIGRVLDKERYPMLEIESQLVGRTAFPAPGTYVEEFFHPFLVMTVDNFEESDFRYVALELEDEEMDADSENANNGGIYIYVHIVKKLQDIHDSFSAVHTKYLVDTGSEEYDEIPAYRLFRFARRAPVLDEIQTFDLNVPHKNLPFNENCKRIGKLLSEAWSLPEIERRRFIRRLMFQWHPDNNQDIEDYARRVFHFIQHVLLHLERDEDIPDEDIVDGQSPEFAGSAYSSMSQKLQKRAKTYVNAFRENLDDYNRYNRASHCNHGQSSAPVYRDTNEAQRWMRQAKCDYEAAVAFLEKAEEPKAYNWICYSCHQASEKALKAACYSKNANEVSLQSHSLVQPANGLSPSLADLAHRLESKLKDHTRMRYPNSVSRPQIPADIFTRDTAEAAIEITDSIIKDSEELINSLPNDNVLDLSKSKAFADDEIKVTENLKFVL